MMRSHTIRGRRWRVEGLRNVRKPALAECITHTNTLRIPVDGDTLAELDTIIHEVLHAATELDEDAVTSTADSIARILWRLDWRKSEREEA